MKKKAVKKLIMKMVRPSAIYTGYIIDQRKKDEAKTKAKRKKT